MALLVQVALDAEVMSSELGDEPSLTMLLLLFQADAERQAGRRLDGIATLDRVAERLGDDEPLDPLFGYVEARHAFVRAELDELDREFDRAWQGFDHARQLLAAIFNNEGELSVLLDDYLDQVFGPRSEIPDGQEAGLSSQFELTCRQSYVGAVLGCFRTVGASGLAVADEIAEQLIEVVETNGLISGTSPFLLIEPIGQLELDRADDLIEVLRTGRRSASSEILSSASVDGLSPEIVEVLERMVTPEDPEGPAATAWTISMELGRARAAAAAGFAHDDVTAMVQQTVASAVRRPGSLTKVCAIGEYVTQLGQSENLDEGLLRMFLLALGGTIEAEPSLFEDLRYRALMDEPISALTRWAIERPDALTATDERLALSVLLDLSRRSEPPPPGVFRALTGHEGETSAAIEGQILMSDTLWRIIDALSERPGCLVLITQRVGRTSHFVTIDSSGAQICSSDDPGDVVEELDQAAQWMVDVGPRRDGDPVAEAAITAFRQLPNEVQIRLQQATTVYVVPDFSWVADVFPYELLHDGSSYLLESTVVARFTSLQQLAATLDTRIDKPVVNRALVTAAPTGLPDRPLVGAGVEQEAIGLVLREAGFDTPRIEPDRLSALFFADRLPYVDLVHIAAHGESAAGIEYVCLEGSQRLSVDDVAASPAPWMPFVYLNTCMLARTRYLGGGQGRGLAYTFAELGSPAVVANTAMVLDEVSTALATAFYEAALNHPVGEAMRIARNETIDLGYHPALVGRVVLFGDPHHLLAVDRIQPDDFDLASRVLDNFFDPETDDAPRDKVVELANARLGDGSPDLRLQATALLLHELEEPDSDLSGSIGLADALRHPPAQALLRYMRSNQALDDGLASGVAWTRESIDHLRRLESQGGPWSRLLLEARSRLRQIDMSDRGLEFTKRGPGAEDDELMDAVIQVIAGTQQAQEETLGETALRPREESRSDMAWNAVVVGHPNRFEDPAEAVAFSRLLCRKLQVHGHLPELASANGAEMLVGLLWFLWSDQQVGYLSPDLAEGQAGTVEALLDDIAANWTPLSDGPTKTSLDAFVTDVDRTIRSLEGMTWEEVVPAIKERIPPLADRAEATLEEIGRNDPSRLAGSAALIAGVLASRNTFSFVDGSVPESKQEQLTSALWRVSNDNESRFGPYLMDGFASIRDREADELMRWRLDNAGPMTNDAP